MPASDRGARSDTVVVAPHPSLTSLHDMSKLLRRLRRHRRASSRGGSLAGPPAITLAAGVC
jgi:hypothetical protein